jgi:hypothetical protein
MVDFSYLGALEVSVEHTSEYPMHQIQVNGKSPTLIVAPATDVNKPYFNVLLKRSGKTAKQLKAGAQVSTDMLEDSREEDKALYPKYVIKDWRDMVDAETGKDIPFSVADCVKFIEALPNWLFDNMVKYCTEPSNFVDVMDVDTKAGN